MNRSARVLVIDDEPFMRAVLTEYLAPEGYEITLAKQGCEAWQLLQNSSEPFDVVISDRKMPLMNGMELLKKIKSDPKLKNTPVIFQTGLVKREEVEEGIMAGVYHYLEKPYDPKVLLSLVSNAVEEHRMNRELQQASQDRQLLEDMLACGEFRCRTLEQARQMTPFLAQLCPQPDRVVTGLSELLVNAIEHGNLGIDYQEKTRLLANGIWKEEVERLLETPEHRDKFVLIRLERDDSRICFTISDQGQGFDPSSYLDFDPARLTHSHGRGIAMSRMFSFDLVEYLGCGNRVRATIWLGSGTD